jgi:GNAT superfamily N-acetyltransferase
LSAEITSVPLAEHHEVAGFDCGVESLNDWLAQFALRARYLLARLAVHGGLRGQGYGGQLLVDALDRAARAAETGGGRLVVVDALDDAAAAFYRHHDFTSVKDNPHRLVLKIASIRWLLG